MSYTPADTRRPNETSIHTFSYDAVGFETGMIGLTRSTITWPSANLAIFIPIRIVEVVTVKKMWWFNGTVTGNVDVGIYSESQVRLVSSGSTAASGNSALQIIDITDTVLTPARYYMAMAVNNNTDTFVGTSTASALTLQSIGPLEQTSAFALPDPATFAKITQTILPDFGLTLETTI